MLASAGRTLNSPSGTERGSPTPSGRGLHAHRALGGFPHRAGFAYADAHLLNGEVLPLLRLRYGGSANHWGVALYRPSTGKYEDQVWFTGTPVEALDFAGGVLLIAADI